MVDRKPSDLYRTPLGVVRQGLAEMAKLYPLLQRQPVPRIIDYGAGDGRFGWCATEVWPGPWMVASEVRTEEHEKLRGIYDDVVGDYRDAPGAGQYDLALGNWPFSLWHKILPEAVAATNGGMVATLGLSSWGHSTEPSEAREVFEAFPPSYQLRIQGRIMFLAGKGPGGKRYGSDNRKYSWWVWGLPRAGQGWVCRNLPEISKAERTIG